MTMTPNTRYGVALLGAGGSQRMGKPKLLLPWGGTSILGHQIRLWHRLGVDQVAVVYRANDAALCAELDRLGVGFQNQIRNPKPELGMFGSIQCASRWTGWEAALTHWVIGLGDQPHLRPETLETLLAFSSSHPTAVCQPRRLGRLFHPVILPRKFFAQLPSTPATTLKKFLNKIPGEVAGCDVDDPGVAFDIDTPIDYERALSEFAGDTGSGDEPRATPSL
jgi:molybdenum cofactor cytidylyltransferase